MTFARIWIVQKPFDYFSNTVNCSFFFLIFLKLLKWKDTIFIFSKMPNQKLLQIIKTEKIAIFSLILSNDRHCIINCCIQQNEFHSEKYLWSNQFESLSKKKVMACLLDEPCFQPKDFPQRQFRLREIFYDLSDDLFIDVRVISQMDFRVWKLAGFIIT